MLRKTSPEDIKSYLKDASNCAAGQAEGVVFPETEQDVIDFVLECNEKGTPITVAGNGTGLTGARVPHGGWVLATERMGQVKSIERTPLGQGSKAVVGPGLYLKDFLEQASSHDLLYPADPTSILSFIGGNVATNASGPRSFKYGATREFVDRLRMVLTTGDILDIRRGDIFVKNHKVTFPVMDARGNKKNLEVPVPSYTMPDIKNTAGYFIKEGMDAIDIFIGSEGTLGILTEIELKLLPAPAHVFSLIIFFSSEEDSWKFAEEVRERSLAAMSSRNDTQISARAIEYMDGPSLDLIRDQYHDIPEKAKAAIYVEQECQEETQEILLEQWYILFEKYEILLNNTWLADDHESDERFREFRHAIPLHIRELLKKKGQQKVGTDYAVPHDKFEEMMLYQRKRLEELKLDSANFGHIGESHLHLNMLPNSEDEFKKAKELYQELIEKVLEMGGTISAEHGIGKIKIDYLKKMYGEKALEEMAAMKKAFDPKGLLGRGNIFPETLLA